MISASVEKMCYANKSLKQNDCRAEDTAGDSTALEHVLRSRASVCVSLRFVNKIRYQNVTGERFCTLSDT
jgi:hypothetical protein